MSAISIEVLSITVLQGGGCEAKLVVADGSGRSRTHTYRETGEISCVDLADGKPRRIRCTAISTDTVYFTLHPRSKYEVKAKAGIGAMAVIPGVRFHGSRITAPSYEALAAAGAEFGADGGAFASFAARR